MILLTFGQHIHIVSIICGVIGLKNVLDTIIVGITCNSPGILYTDQQLMI